MDADRELRAALAGMALQGLLAGRPDTQSMPSGTTMLVWVDAAVKVADALLAQLKEPP